MQRRVLTWRTLLLVSAGRVVFYVLHGLAFRVYNYDSTSVGADGVLLLVAAE